MKNRLLNLVEVSLSWIPDGFPGPIVKGFLSLSVSLFYFSVVIGIYNAHTISKWIALIFVGIMLFVALEMILEKYFPFIEHTFFAATAMITLGLTIAIIRNLGFQLLILLIAGSQYQVDIFPAFVVYFGSFKFGALWT